ncbi:MAG: SHOCT domain-containing protein [Oscillospiraceae bacterium]|nr:SHOCT domain-containing protein [Oscillospiraceae bacterium]
MRHTRPAADQTKLEQLKALRQAGLLSEEEYQEKKREL